MGVSHVTVSKTLQRLARDNFVTYRPYRKSHRPRRTRKAHVRSSIPDRNWRPGRYCRTRRGGHGAPRERTNLTGHQCISSSFESLNGKYALRCHWVAIGWRTRSRDAQRASPPARLRFAGKQKEEATLGRSAALRSVLEEEGMIVENL
jgi:hypothetical protein